jgi:uncharacterized protein YbjT (DUF2867 family)
VGRHCLRTLLAAPHYTEVVAIGRRPVALDHERLRQLVIDFERIEDALRSIVVDDVFCCLGTTMQRARSREAFRRVDFVYPLALAKAARARGAKQFVLVSSLGANRQGRAFYLRTKGELEEALAALGFRALIIVRPSVLLGGRGESRPGETVAKVVMQLAAPLLIGRLRKYRPVAARRVALAMVAAANQDLSGLVVLESDELSPAATAYTSTT